MTKKQIFILALSIVNLVSQIFIFLLHQGKLDTIGIESIQELGFYVLIPAALLAVAALTKFEWTPKLLHFFGLLSLSTVILVMAIHIGVRDAVSFFEHPQYLISIFTSIAVITL